MELANGKKNKFFTLETEGENRYYIEDFNAEETKGLNNVYLLAKEVDEDSIVLDIGCGQGRFGRILKEKNCTVYGVDLDEKAIEYAKNSGYYDKTFVMDITDKNSNEYNEFIKMVKYVDVIIISDVFEHVDDPTKLLLEYSKLLKENGIILISVPNVSHIDISLNLMNDKFNYQEMGILDNTHLKFFTKTSFVDWINQINDTFNEINFECEYLGATFYNNEFLCKIKQEYNELFTILENVHNYNGLQILFKLTKINKNSIPLQLQKLQEEIKTDVVGILGNALKGKINNVQDHKLVEGERLWYEQQLKILQEGINWHNDNDKKMQKSLSEKDRYMKELQEGINWHSDNSNKVQELLSEKDRYIKELREGIDWHNENSNKIQELLSEKDRYIKELREGIDWHNENSNKAQELLNEKDRYIKELQEGIDWHNENSNKVQELLNEKDRYIKELQEGIDWHNENSNKVQGLLNEKDRYIRELQEGISWHNKNDINVKALTEQKQSEFEIQINSDRQKVLELRKKIFDMEDSRSWRWTKFLRKSE